MFFMSSCSSTLFYQVYKTSSSLQVSEEEDNLYYEDENCIVSYNLWSEEGNAGFQFYNKTEETIYLNLAKSFFVLNGIAYDYFKNRISFRLDIAEKDVIAIPSKTAKIVSEFRINESRIRNCDLYQFPTKNQIKTDSFSKENSPIVFSNRLVYRLENAEEEFNFENEFFVSEIANYPSDHILKSERVEFCGEKSMSSRRYNLEYAPNKFYIKYTKGKGSNLKH